MQQSGGIFYNKKKYPLSPYQNCFTFDGPENRPARNIFRLVPCRFFALCFESALKCSIFNIKRSGTDLPSAGPAMAEIRGTAYYQRPQFLP